MKRLKISILNLNLLIVITLLISTCKKFPEGGTTYNTYKKLTTYDNDGHKVWILKSFTVNGIDSLDFIVSMGQTPRPVDKSLAIAYADEDHSKMLILLSYDRSYLATVSKDCKQIAIIPRYDIDTLPCFVPGFCARKILCPEKLGFSEAVWDIRELTKTDFVLETKLNHIYRLQYKKEKW